VTNIKLTKFQKKEFTGKRERFEQERWESKVAFIKSTNNVRPIFSKETENKVIDLIRWDENVHDICAPTAPHQDTWLTRQRAVIGSVTRQILTLQNERNPKKLKELADQTVALVGN